MDMRVSHTSGTMQHPTPPASSASSTPSPSNAPSLHSNATRIIQSKVTGYSTPSPQSARTFSAGAQAYFHGQLVQIPFTQSSPVSATLEAGAETPKRKATEAPQGRPRGQTLSQMRPQSMVNLPSSQSHSAFLQQNPRYIFDTANNSISRDPSNNTQQDANQEANTPQPGTFDNSDGSNLNDNTTRQSSSEGFWNGSDDPVEQDSNKRPKSELRGVEGRKWRTVSNPQKPRPRLSRRSTGSIMVDLNITGNNDDNLDDDLPVTPATRPAAEFKVWRDEEQTPVKKSGSQTRRAPLTDISLSIGTPTMPAVFFNTKQLGPLMTRQPKKVVSPFPQCQHYWDEYANDTFNYLLEIESRYDRYLYFDEHSEFGDYRATLVQWIIELCYGWFKLPPGTLHVAVNILDRYLAVVKPETIHRDKLQCIGMCALMIAGKLEEPAGTLGTYNLCQLCDLYSTREIANMEVDILKALKFEILVASATGFSDYIQRAIVDHEETRQLIDFLCDLSLISHHFLEFNTCQIAAAAVWISLCAIGLDWNEDLAILTGYSRNDLSPCSVVFSDLVLSTDNPLDLRATLNFRYPVDQTMTTLRTVLAR
ncbi:G2/mitotic-specific cyclin-B3 [Linnemannia elongata]|nr:G2/mitotic-specific cyclin-B3 [Linnemannia elongata]